MRASTLLLLFATAVLGQSGPSDVTQVTDLFADPTLSCQGTTFFTGYIPTSTVTVIVDGNYTYTQVSNGSIPTAVIYEIPLPACHSIVVPEPSTLPVDSTTYPLPDSTYSSSSYSTYSSSNYSSSASSAFSASSTSSASTANPTPPTNTTTNTPVSPSSIVITSSWTETVTDISCGTAVASINSTSRTGGPYGNSSTTAVETRCSTTSYLTSGTVIYTSEIPSIIYSPISSEIVSQSAPYPSTAPAYTASSQGTIPEIPTAQNGPPEVSIGSSVAQTSVVTVTITKKTPVAAPAENTPPQILFPGVSDDKITLNQNTPTTGGGANSGGNSGGLTPTGGNNSPTGGNSPAGPRPTGNSPAGTSPNGNSPTGTSPNGNSPAGTSPNGNSPTTAANNSPGGSNNPPNSNNDANGGTVAPTGGNNNPTGSSSAGGGGLGSIIESAFNSPWTSVGVATSYGAASATVTLVNGVPVQIDSSSVYIGGSYVALPTGSSTTVVTVNGQTFTVAPNAVVGSSTTLEIERVESISYSPVQAATLQASTITQGDVVVTIKPDAAVVDGTTYSIGLNAEATTIVVNGETITLNSNGVVFASTTYRPAIITAAAYVVTTIGDLTFSIDSSEAIISGTTYRIGAGALNTIVTTVIDGTTVLFGPSGIILPSTTIAPTGVSLTGTNARSTRTGNSATMRVVSDSIASATGSGNAAPVTSQPPAYLTNIVCIFAMALSLTTLPLSLFL